MKREGGETRLRQFIEDESESLHRTLCFYVIRAGLANGQAVGPEADELLNEVVVEALQQAARFHPTGQPKAWLLGIAANLIKRQQAERARRHRREPLVRDLYPEVESDLSDGELFDQFAAYAADNPAQDIETNEQIAGMLAAVSQGEQHVLRLALVHGLDGDLLAKELGVSPGAARVRLHRALQHLREAHRLDQGHEAHE
jgi:RNA polymerase sigma-70 factor, ECF subfamily